jgi:ABC-type lipoprotein release transport system permease subunit
MKSEIDKKLLTPVLVVQATAYPKGRMQGVILKGIEPEQTVLSIPSEKLKQSGDVDYAVIGKRMAQSADLKQGDRVLIRWRDRNGTFDAREVEIGSIFRCDVPAADRGQIYLRLDVLQKMTGLENEATLLVAGEGYMPARYDKWDYKDSAYLLSDMDKIIQAKKSGGVIMEGLLLIIALIAIFDTQVLSIFRRQKEIGTYIALGMTRLQVVGIFTVEGSAHSILATILGAIYGIPLFLWIGKTGIPMKAAQATDLAVGDSIIPYYSIRLIIISVILVIISATIVSYLPARKIARMKPTDALKGKLI